MIRVALADDHALVRHGIKMLLSLDERVRVAVEFSTGWGLLQNLSAGLCDLIVMDLKMPGPPAIELIKRLRSDYPALPVLILSMLTDAEIVSRAMRAGAGGYIGKDNDPEYLIRAITQVAAGQRYIDSSLAEKIAFDSMFIADDEPHKQFSDREFQVFSLLQDGKSSKEIAILLNLSIKTVSTYKSRIMKKLGVRSDIELLRYAIERQLTNLD